MNGCDRYVILMSAKLDEALTEQEEQELNKHLDACPHCRALWKELSAICDVVHAMPDVEPPEDLKGRILQAVQDTPHSREEPRTAKPARRAPWQRTAVAAAAAVVVLVGSLAVWQNGWLNRAGTENVSPAQQEHTAGPKAVTGPEQTADGAGKEAAFVNPSGETAESSQPTRYGQAPGEETPAASPEVVSQAPQEEGNSPSVQTFSVEGEEKLPDQSAVTAMLLCYDVTALPETPDYLVSEGDTYFCPAEHFSDLQEILKEYQVITVLEPWSGYTGVAGEWIQITLVP